MNQAFRQWDAESLPAINADAQERFESLTRYVAGMKTDKQRAEFLALVEKRHGNEVAERLRRAAWELCKKQ